LVTHLVTAARSISIASAAHVFEALALRVVTCGLSSHVGCRHTWATDRPGSLPDARTDPKAGLAQRAPEPGSKLAATGWVAERVAIEGCSVFSDDAAYAAMDFLQ